MTLKFSCFVITNEKLQQKYCLECVMWNVSIYIYIYIYRYDVEEERDITDVAYDRYVSVDLPG